MDNQSMFEKFGITKIDVNNRSFAGMFFDGKIYIGKEHLRCISEYKERYEIDVKKPVAFLNFLKHENNIIAFIDFLCILGTKPDNGLVIQAIIQEISNVSNIYLYRHPDTITQLY